jgi:hypothetical protein
VCNHFLTIQLTAASLLMTKQEFFKDIEDIKSDKLLITDSVDNLNEEIKNNCWSIQFDDELSMEFSVDELADFLKEVKTNRRKQLKQSKIKVGLIYYVWVDGQAGQLRFNFINSNHEKLPFRSQLTFVTKEDEILTDYLTRPHTYLGTTKVFKELIVV